MKKHYIILIFITTFLFNSCQNPKDKPVIETLSVDEISSLINKDDMYKSVIKDVESVREKLENDIITKSKFKDLTYSDYFNYIKVINRSEFGKLFEELRDKGFERIIKPENDSLLGLYKSDIDEEYNYLRKKCGNTSFPDMPESYRELFWGMLLLGEALNSEKPESLTTIYDEYIIAIENNRNLVYNDYMNIIYQKIDNSYTYEDELLFLDESVLAQLKEDINKDAYKFECLINGIAE